MRFCLNYLGVDMLQIFQSVLVYSFKRIVHSCFIFGATFWLSGI